jgi:thiamine biosynthesis protein ThiS
MTARTSASTISINVNGQHETVPMGMTILDLLNHRRLGTKLVAVERNGEILSKDAFATTPLEDHDQLEIVHFVGGG